MQLKIEMKRISQFSEPNCGEWWYNYRFGRYKMYLEKEKGAEKNNQFDRWRNCSQLWDW